MPKMTPQELASKWATRTGAATQDVVNGVDRVTEHPGQKANPWLDAVSTAALAAAVDAAEKMGQYFWRLAEKRLTDPQDDLITQLLKKDIPRSDAIQARRLRRSASIAGRRHWQGFPAPPR